eukprot:Ihof_evm3s119 gene=Ihof_evmTU3s119
MADIVENVETELMEGLEGERAEEGECVETPLEQEEEENVYNEKDEHGAMIGHKGGDYIRANLFSTDPAYFIDQFQSAYGLNEQTHKTILTVLPLLDALGISRAKTYKHCLHILKDKLLARIDKMPEDVLDDLLHKTFPYIGQHELSAIPMELLRRHPNPPPSLLENISSNPAIYQMCPMEVKQKVWMQEENAEAQKLFREQVFKLLTGFINDKAIIASANDLSGIHGMVPKARRKHEAIVQLVEVVGTFPTLYEMVVRFLHRLFITTRNRLFCTLRSELLMALFDADVPQIYETDRCHKFVWCLDSCKRGKIIDKKRVEEMQNFFSVHVHLDDPIISDIAMIIIDPFTGHMFIQNCFDYLVALVDKHELPKNEDKIRYLTQIVGLGLYAHKLIEVGSYEIPPCDDELIRSSMPALMAFMVDDQVRANEIALGQKLSNPGAVPKEFLTKLESSELLQKLVGLYLLSRTQARDVVALQRLLGVITEIKMDLVVFDSLESLVLQLGADEGFEETRMALVEEFFLPCSSQTASQHLRVVHLIAQLNGLRPFISLATVVQSLIDCGVVGRNDTYQRSEAAKAYHSLLGSVGTKGAESLGFVNDYINSLDGPVEGKEDEEEIYETDIVGEEGEIDTYEDTHNEGDMEGMEGGEGGAEGMGSDHLQTMDEATYDGGMAMGEEGGVTYE